MFELSGSGLDDWKEIPNLAVEVGGRRLSDHLYWECRKEYDLQPQKLAWQFWKAMREVGNCAGIFSKIEQVSSARLNK